MVALLVAIMAVEEMPAGARAFSVSVLTMTAGLGAGLCVANLVYVDLAVGAWRIAFLIPLLAVYPAFGSGRSLPETHRFAARKLLLSTEGVVGDVPDIIDADLRAGRRPRTDARRSAPDPASGLPGAASTGAGSSCSAAPASSGRCSWRRPRSSSTSSSAPSGASPGP